MSSPFPIICLKQEIKSRDFTLHEPSTPPLPPPPPFLCLEFESLAVACPPPPPLERKSSHWSILPFFFPPLKLDESLAEWSSSLSNNFVSSSCFHYQSRRKFPRCPSPSPSSSLLFYRGNKINKLFVLRVPTHSYSQKLSRCSLILLLLFSTLFPTAARKRRCWSARGPPHLSLSLSLSPMGNQLLDQSPSSWHIQDTSSNEISLRNAAVAKMVIEIMVPTRHSSYLLSSLRLGSKVVPQYLKA